MNKNVKPPCSDKALKAKTGRNWEEWCRLLDADSAMALEHKELAKFVGPMHRAGSWWSQTIAVGYEQLRGKRAPNERSNSTFSAGISKTLAVSASDAHAFFVDEKKRSRWLKEKMVIRKATAPKSVRITCQDETSVSVWITAKGENKCTLAVEHSKLTSQAAVTAKKKYWKEAFQHLAKVAV